MILRIAESVYLIGVVIFGLVSLLGAAAMARDPQLQSKTTPTERMIVMVVTSLLWFITVPLYLLIGRKTDVASKPKE